MPIYREQAERLMDKFSVDEQSRSFWEKASIEMPKVALWMAVFLLASRCSMSATDVKAYAEIDKLALKTADDLFRKSNEIEEREC